MSTRWKRPATVLGIAGLALGITLAFVALIPGSGPGSAPVDGRGDPTGQSPADVTGPGAGQTAATSTAAANPTGETLIITDLADATIGYYGTRTRKTFEVVADGLKLHYKWQHQSPSGGRWKTIAGAKSARYTAKARNWASGTRFRVIVTGTRGAVTSRAAQLLVVSPTRTPAADAQTAFGLTGLTQGVDISAYQHTPEHKVNLDAVASWSGAGGFAILRNGSGARPIRQTYTSVCTGRKGRTGAKPAVQDCAYRRFADAAEARGLRLGHYWFNGWITSLDSTERNLFSGDYTPEASAAQFVDWLITDGNYTRSSTDPLVLDIEAGRSWTRVYKGRTYKRTLRAWNPTEAAAFLDTVRSRLVSNGYQANLYVYMSANATARRSADGTFVWAEVAALARLWVASWGTNNGRIPDFLPEVGPWVDHGGWSIWQYTSNANLPGDGVGAIDGDIAMADAWIPR